MATSSRPEARTQQRPLHGVWLGRRPYRETYELQQQLHEHVKQAAYDVVLLLEHEPTITLGRGAHPEHLLADEAALAERGVSLCPSDRGGDITLHAPGQLVAYPIVNLNHGRKDVRRYVNSLTSCMQRITDAFGVSAGAIPGMVGLWTDLASVGAWPGAEQATAPAKLGAIGVRISRWVTMHGFALNLTTDLSLFRLIVPCGISTHPVASVQSVTGHAPSCSDAAQLAHEHLYELLDLAPGKLIAHDGPQAASQLVERLMAR